MAPFSTTLRFRSFNPSRVANEFHAQWTRPGDVFTILLILGGDVIARALAQIAGSGLSTVAFSFGWVAYAISALVSAVGENKLMAVDPDCKCKVINGKSGYTKDNTSWVIGRIVRDFPYWGDQAVQTKTTKILHERWEQLKNGDPKAQMPPMAGLTVSIYRPSTSVKTGIVEGDLVYWIGVPVMVVQLGIAAIPCATDGDWGILLITACGIALAIATGFLPQWEKEKWACRPNANHPYVLTRGNGSQHAIVVLGNGHGFNLEDLASGQTNTLVLTNTSTRVALLMLACLWILLLITAAGQLSNTWFLLAIGGIGILQNIYVAGAQRKPENFGFPLEYVTVFANISAMETLYEVETQYKDLGRSMIEEFFPGELRDHEIDKWASLRAMWVEKSKNESKAEDTQTGARAQS